MKDDLMEKMLKKRAPMLTISIGEMEQEGMEPEAMQAKPDDKDLAPKSSLNDEDVSEPSMMDGMGEQMAEGEEMDEKSMEMARLREMLGEDVESEEDMQMPDRKMGLGEAAKMNMKKRLLALKK
jgi:hypothetical protein